MRMTAHALTVTLLLAVGLTACGSDAPEVTHAPPAAAQTPPTPRGGATDGPEPITGEVRLLAFLRTEVGICSSPLDDDPKKVVDYAVIPCEQPHQAETYSASYLIDSAAYTSYPNGEEMAHEIQEACHDPFEDYVGIDRYSSSYAAHAYYPSPNSWAEGDRAIDCLIVSKDGSLLTGSARNTRK